MLGTRARVLFAVLGVGEFAVGWCLTRADEAAMGAALGYGTVEAWYWACFALMLSGLAMVLGATLPETEA